MDKVEKRDHQVVKKTMETMFQVRAHMLKMSRMKRTEGKYLENQLSYGGESGHET